MPSASLPNSLNPFQLILRGTWANVPLPGATKGEGGLENPLSYNVMPLPQTPPQAGQNLGYILKNSTVTEILKFNTDIAHDASAVAVPTTAANRGETNAQLSTALYYEQQVLFGDGPGKGTVVHTENGTWLNLPMGEEMIGPYSNGAVLATQPARKYTIAKQMSVPHGNSVLALGNFDGPTTGVPDIQAPDGFSIYPVGSPLLDHSPFDTQLADESKPPPVDNPNYQNPNVAYTQDPYQPLTTAMGFFDASATSYYHWSVNTAPDGMTMNIPFENGTKAVGVTAYSADYWLLSTDEFRSENYLAYLQNITLSVGVLPTGGTSVTYTIPHVTCNVVTQTTKSLP